MRPLLTTCLVLGALAACLGVTLTQRNAGSATPGAAASGQRPGVDRYAQTEIDQGDVLPLTAVRAPADTGEKAFEHVRTLVGFGARYTGMPGWTQQLEYIAAALEKLGLTVQRDTWTDRKELKTFTNLSVSLPGKRKDRIVLACHHDTKCTTGHPDAEHNFPFVGANDGGSGVGLLLALAPVLAATEREATIELVFFDGEESLDWKWNDAARALFGSKRFVKRQRDAELLGEAEPIRALVLLDMVGRTELHIQEELYSTTLLRRITWSAAVATGNQKSFYRRAEAASDDHVPFLDVGIPAVDLIDLKDNPHWHNATDTLDNMSPKSLQIVADVVLTMLPEIERAYVVKKN
ncbi:MAG: M28 family peptidase [Planctomycetes bacterium]|nr:M28 family peptidase [Planctomycetota bacterium]MCB9884773.1 M28 family peptidase [Planctomycetota bacterium]